MKCPIFILTACILAGCASTQTKQGSGRAGIGSPAYIAEIGSAQDTRYFQVVGKVRCDEFDKTILIFNPPEWTTGWNRRQMFHARPVVERCGKAFRDRYAQGDPALQGSDGVLIDGQTASIAGEYRFVAEGWSIKFSDPSKEDISQRLKTPAKQAIDVLQLRTVLNWVKAHRQPNIYRRSAQFFLQFSLAILPMAGRSRNGRIAHHGRHRGSRFRHLDGNSARWHLQVSVP